MTDTRPAIALRNTHRLLAVATVLAAVALVMAIAGRLEVAIAALAAALFLNVFVIDGLRFVVAHIRETRR